MKADWDIFCCVVDNFGDIGVTWRLARQLVAEHGLGVRLWVDELEAFARICPQADVAAADQMIAGVRIMHWPQEWPETEVGDVVIQAFGCTLPAACLQRMRDRPAPVLCLNLEYLSAEDWVEGCHGLPSMLGQGLRKYFFFPGFTDATGGLLREQGLLDRRDSLQADPAARMAFLGRLGVHARAGERLFSLFAYENACVGPWLEALRDDGVATRVLVPQGRVLASVEQWCGRSGLVEGDEIDLGSLVVQVLPFVPQDDYDRLLWCCDFNAVRGEDSFVRAQWAGRPMLWHIYRQEEDAHLVKLEAFLALYTHGLPAEQAEAIQNFWRAWNTDGDVATHWRNLAPLWPQVIVHARQWCDTQAARQDLAMALVQFHQNWL